MWCKCVCKYCICDISAIVNENFIFTQYFVDVTYTIFTNTFVPHFISSKYIVNPNYHAVISLLHHYVYIYMGLAE